MTRATIRMVLCGALVCLTAAVSSAQTTTETKKFQVISVDGNQLVVKLPEGTREITVPEGFHFTVDGKQLTVGELKPGMAGTATITTKTTVVPVTVTEVKNGVVMQNMGSSILVKTDGGMKMFSQGDMDKRGVKIMKDGKLVDISELRANDQLTATIVTSKPPRIMTEKQVQASLAKSAGGGARARPRRAAPAGRCDRRTRRQEPARGGDVGRRAEKAAQDRQPFAASGARGPCVADCGVGSHRHAASRLALIVSPTYAGPSLATGGAGPARRSRRAM